MIHPTAVISKAAKLDKGVSIGPYAVVEEGVELAAGVTLAAYVHLSGRTFIGENTFIGTGSVIGTPAQMLGVRKNCGKVQIGKDNIIREYVTIHSSLSADKSTFLGDNNFLMSFSHLGHDCRVGNGAVICNGALIAGHVQIQDKAFISGNVVVHQFVRLGRLAMVGGLSRVNQDVPPFMTVVGDSRVWGINLVGLKRADFEPEAIREIKTAYHILYRRNLPFKKAVNEIEKTATGPAKELIVFILSSRRGICGPKRSTLRERLFLDYPYFLRSKIPTYAIFHSLNFRRRCPK